MMAEQQWLWRLVDGQPGVLTGIRRTNELPVQFNEGELIDALNDLERRLREEQVLHERAWKERNYWADCAEQAEAEAAQLRAENQELQEQVSRLVEDQDNVLSHADRANRAAARYREALERWQLFTSVAGNRVQVPLDEIAAALADALPDDSQ